MRQTGRGAVTEEQMDAVIDAALAEDTSQGDITSEVLIPVDLVGRASLLVKEEGVLAGGEVARRVFLKVDPALKVSLLMQDGSRASRGDVLGTVSGRMLSILRAERTAVNFLQRLCGIATLTARYVEEVRGLPVDIMDTRKTTPGLRLLEKHAVLMGGGKNHRFHLGDGILIKDNHLGALRALGLGLKDVVARARSNAPPGVVVEVEVTSLREALDAVETGADIILLDNMAPGDMEEVVEHVSGRARIEASGGITLDNVRQVAMTGVNMISVGALTHSVKALDISLEVEPQMLRLS
ncbi:MAG: carboxylating nicotinate-nucleotide diphosphorylase [Chloroflexi bacterium]|nr:carboxylating nicotinate-nucleotide diphosphorylase [Chloroflexota bacterium]